MSQLWWVTNTNTMDSLKLKWSIKSNSKWWECHHPTKWNLLIYLYHSIKSKRKMLKRSLLGKLSINKLVTWVPQREEMIAIFCLTITLQWIKVTFRLFSQMISWTKATITFLKDASLSHLFAKIKLKNLKTQFLGIDHHRTYQEKQFLRTPSVLISQ